MRFQGKSESKAGEGNVGERDKKQGRKKRRRRGAVMPAIFRSEVLSEAP